MKRRHSAYIVVALLLTLCSQIALYVSVTSENWVVAEHTRSCCANVSLISYGLFYGSVNQVSRNLTVGKSKLSLSCLYKLNVCAWTCQPQEFRKEEDVEGLYNLGILTYSCIDYKAYNISIGEMVSLQQMRDSFIDGVAWLLTVAATSLAAVTGFAGLCLTAYNINHISSSYFISIRGLYFWYTITSTLAAISLSIWGLEYAMKLYTNIGTIDTIAGLVNTTGKSHLGYSYWCQVIVMILQLTCAALLQYRENLFDCPMFVSSLDFGQRNTLAIRNI